MGDPRTTATARVGVLVGVLAPAIVLLSPWKGLALAAVLVFAAAGLGPGIMCWLDAGEAYAQLGITFALSLSCFALAAAIMIWLAAWHPLVLLALAIPSVLSCLRRLARRPPPDRLGEPQVAR
ncbi:MAG TPA: hypothetical protein VL972_06980 [Solirubrobacteraceae bacterium]|nr:hypothetical protein [Solirubrobacteraceae bacterium]